MNMRGQRPKERQCQCDQPATRRGFVAVVVPAGSPTKSITTKQPQIVPLCTSPNKNALARDSKNPGRTIKRSRATRAPPPLVESLDRDINSSRIMCYINNYLMKYTCPNKL